MMVIAVDGTAASGKGTLAKKLAAHYKFAHLDSGALYRAVALSVLRAGADPNSETAARLAAESLDTRLTSSMEIRTPEVGTAASIVAAFGSVRAALVNLQREFAVNPPNNCQGSVLDGRDIGTVICPQADVKFFVDADDRVRAHRRYIELEANARQSGDDFTLQESEVLADIQARDARDKSRAVAPLIAAEDAHLLDTTNLDIEATFEAAREIVERVLSV